MTNQRWLAAAGVRRFLDGDVKKASPTLSQCPRCTYGRTHWTLHVSRECVPTGLFTTAHDE